MLASFAMEFSQPLATTKIASNRRNDAPRSPFKKGGLFPPIALSVVPMAALITWFFLGHAKTDASAAAGGTPAPVEVGVQTATRQRLRLWNEFSGRLHAVDAADIRPEVSGRITEVRFQDGQSVKAGDVLFVIDPRPFEAFVARAEARIESANASLRLTTANQARNVSLLRSKTIAQREADQTDSAKDAAAAELKAAEADLKTAQVDKTATGQMPFEFYFR